MDRAQVRVFRERIAQCGLVIHEETERFGFQFVQVEDAQPFLSKPVLYAGLGGWVVSILALAQQIIAQAQSKSPIEFQTYAEAYDADFEDIRHRVPDLSRLEATIGYQPTFDLPAIIEDVITWRRAVPS